MLSLSDFRYNFARFKISNSIAVDPAWAVMLSTAKHLCFKERF